jgi:hypothetical protein
MAKIISNEEYAKLTRDVDYWKDLALREESYKNFYEALYKVKKEKVIELMRENQSLDRKLEELENKNKLSSIYDKLILQSKLKKIDKEIYSEHNCNLNCFKEHVLPAIQRDYDSKSIQFKNDWHERHCFIQQWKQKLKNDYDFLESLYMIADTIMVAFKA